MRYNMKNGWYNRIYREDLPPCDYWEPDNDIVYIENNKIRKVKNRHSEKIYEVTNESDLSFQVWRYEEII